MVFSSLSFLFCFFPAFLLVYYLTPSRPAGARNAVLLVGSCVFYIIGLDGQWAYFALLAASVLVNYGLGLAITRDKPRAKLWLIVGLCYNFLWLFLFKYLNFLLTGVNGVLGWVSGGKAAVPLLGWALPVGISFYTFYCSPSRCARSRPAAISSTSTAARSRRSARCSHSART